jgi:hypothetical protein
MALGGGSATPQSQNGSGRNHPHLAWGGLATPIRPGSGQTTPKGHGGGSATPKNGIGGGLGPKWGWHVAQRGG